MTSPIFKSHRVYIEYNEGKPFDEKAADTLIFHSKVKKAFKDYKAAKGNRYLQKEIKQQACETLKQVCAKMGYPDADVTMDSKNMQIVSGNKRVLTHGTGGSLSTITWDEEE